jgi:DNA-binding transcriptional ArsR family regulator
MKTERSMDRIIVLARAVGHPTRLDVYRALGEVGLSVTDVAYAYGLSVAGAHHHLAVLRRAGLVTRRYVGRKAIYRWSPERWSLVREHGAVGPSAVAERSTTS